MNEIKKSCYEYEAILRKAESIRPLKIGDAELKFEPQPLSPEMLEKAKIELRETEENVRKGLADIREYLKSEPNLYFLDEDFFLTKFLRPCKWHAKSAFELMKRYYRFRINHPKYYKNLLPSINQNSLSSGLLTPLPKRTKDGCKLVLIEGGKKWNPKEVTLEQTLCCVMLLMDGAILEPITQVNGIHIIFDMDGLSLSQVTYFSPSFANVALEWLQKCLPMRVKGIHIVNQPFIFNMIYAIFKPFFMEKFRKRLHFHGRNHQALLSHIDADALPSIFGGNFKIPDEPLGEKIFQYFSLFEEEYAEAEKFGYTHKQ